MFPQPLRSGTRWQRSSGSDRGCACRTGVHFAGSGASSASTAQSPPSCRRVRRLAHHPLPRASRQIDPGRLQGSTGGAQRRPAQRCHCVDARPRDADCFPRVPGRRGDGDTTSRGRTVPHALRRQTLRAGQPAASARRDSELCGRPNLQRARRCVHIGLSPSRSPALLRTATRRDPLAVSVSEVAPGISLPSEPRHAPPGRWRAAVMRAPDSVHGARPASFLAGGHLPQAWPRPAARLRRAGGLPRRGALRGTGRAVDRWVGGAEPCVGFGAGSGHAARLFQKRICPDADRTRPPPRPNGVARAERGARVGACRQLRAVSC